MAKCIDISSASGGSIQGNFQLKHLVMHLKVSTQILEITLRLVTDAVAAVGVIRCRQDFVLIMHYERAYKKCILYYVLASGGIFWSPEVLRPLLGCSNPPQY
jgi:hypothetical protein